MSMAMVAVGMVLLTMTGAGFPQPSEPSRQEVLLAASEIMQAAGICGLVTLDASGAPQARAMDPFAPEKDFTVWMATNAATRKVKELRRDPRATLFYFDASSFSYVTLVGEIEIVTSESARRAHWKPRWDAFYEDGSMGPDYLLLRFRAARVEVVSPSRGIAGDPGAWSPAIVELR